MEYFRLLVYFGLSILMGLKAVRDGRRMKRTGVIELDFVRRMALAGYTKRYGSEAGRIRRREMMESLTRTRYPDNLIAGGALTLSWTIMILVFTVIGLIGLSGN